MKIDAIKAFATVKWATPDECGLEFDEPVPRDAHARLRQSTSVAISTHLTVDERLAFDNWVLGSGR